MSPRLYFGIAALLVIVSAAGIGVVATRGAKTPPIAPDTVGRPADSGIGPSAYSDSPSTQAFAGIDQRSADAAPLTRAEVFATAVKTLTDRDVKARLVLADSQLDTDCATAIWGAKLGDELRGGGCSQVVRGGYLDKKAGYAAMIAIFNVATGQHAGQVVDTLDKLPGAGFVQPLPTMRRFGQGFSLARGRAMGHYAVISWVQRLDHTGDAQDEALLSLLVTVNEPKAILDRAAAKTAAKTAAETG